MYFCTHVNLQKDKKMTDCRNLRYIFFSLLMLVSAVAGATAVDDALAQFDKSQTVAAANAFFRQLEKEQFTDEPVNFRAGTDVDTLRQQVWYWAAEWYNDNQRYVDAKTYGLKALPYCKSGNNRGVEGDCENLLGVIFIRLADYANAAKHARACYELDKAGGDPDMMSSSLNTLAKIYMGARQPKEAETYILQALEQAQKAQNPPRQAILMGTASEIYHTLGEEEKALDYATRARDIELKLGDKSRAATRQVEMGAALLWLKRYDEAQKTLEQAIPQLRADGNLQSLGIACNQMGGVMLHKGQLDEAARYYKEATDIFVNLKDIYNESHSRLGLYNALKASDPQAAMTHMERYKALKDSIYSSETAESLGRYSAEFANEELLMENTAQKATTRYTILVGVIVALVLLAMALIIWLVMRRRNRRQGAINDQLTAHIEELREQYKQLHLNYDLAMSTSQGKDDKEEEKVELSDADREFLERTVETVNSLINAGQIDATTVAERLNMSPYQLRQRLSAVTGNTPQAFIQVIRMRRARYLLDNHPELNVNDVARLCAYNETPNFTRAFKNAFGITPSQYINK